MQLIHHSGAHLHQAMPMPQQLPQIAILRIGHPDSRKALLDHQPQQQLRILPIRLLLAHSLRPDLRRVSDPQLELQVAQQTLEPARVSAGFHPHPHGQILLLEFSVKRFGLSRVGQPTFTALAGFCVYKSNLLEARMIVTTYNQHVRLLSSEPFGWFAPPKSTRAWEPTLFMESLRSLTWAAFSMSANAVSTSLRRLFALPFVGNGQVDRLPTCNKSIMLPERANGWRKAGFGLEYLDAVPS